MRKRIDWNIYHEQPLDRAVVEDVEKRIGFSFPEAYKECVIKYHGARPVQKLFDIENDQRVFGKFFDYDESNNITLLKCYINETDEESGVFPLGVVPFADDPSGNYICFDYGENLENPKVVFLNLDECVSLEILNGDWEDTGINIDEYEFEKDAI